MEHFGVGLHLLWGSEFEVGISYSSLWILSLNFGILRCWGWFGNLEKVSGFCAILQKLGFIHNKPRCMFGIEKNGMIVESLMKMGPKG